MFARWDKMAKQFSRIGKEIAIAVKAGGPDPDTNPALAPVHAKCKSGKYAEGPCGSGHQACAG